MAKEDWSQGAYDRDTMEEQFKETSQMRGRLEALRNVIELEFEDIEHQLKEYQGE